ncbi:hypothetical protein AAFC00_001862 [Neodothiora populina]|uniref:Gamma interferon inducible lysosomal thiol reductase n=1 Tax=Neodothiora populina TaxID=2781224 RepID=A0ABR3PQE6_9PEZI
MEKQPLIEQQQDVVEPTLQDLSVRVEEARINAQTAQRDLFAAQRLYQSAWARTPRGRVFKVFFFGLLAVIALLPITSIFCIALMDDDAVEEYLPRRVPLEAHIMSKCPDARDCLHDLVLPAMVNVSGLVDFKLSYIGSTTDHDDGVVCMHGQTECLGNIVELCAAHIYPDPKQYLGFTMCLSNQYSDIPSENLLQDCALEHGMDFGKLNQCVSDDDGERGVSMLRKSIQRSADNGVTKSCTVRVDDKVYCIRDGGKWTDCENGSEPKDLVDEILERRWQHTAGRE